ncbi:hypothetical protein HOU02_gp202 [Caulobacter phage CcrBL9]|uniref:Uncharacterized protein n=1 Tax=Caulobacter phage CcrBL9 TaxID=2283270 RepID=A0A385ECL9_9CAUD|nr:hypothetical protein HOU02_gp202 [Caulobacter phage CcrBL9]AXQ69523.1 hypothetical protein CcrBL9_gp499 [Caulobacter phage CcrBL9]
MIDTDTFLLSMGLMAIVVIGLTLLIRAADARYDYERGVK